MNHIYQSISVQCPAGTYQKHNECVKCSIGYYNENAGQILCVKCPGNTKTVTKGAKSLQQCI